METMRSLITGLILVLLFPFIPLENFDGKPIPRFWTYVGMLLIGLVTWKLMENPSTETAIIGLTVYFFLGSLCVLNSLRTEGPPF